MKDIIYNIPKDLERLSWWLKESAFNAGDRSLTPVSGDPWRKEWLLNSSILA